MTDATKKRHILITGATSGIGNQLTKDYLLEGHTVYAVGRDDDALAELKSLGAETIDLDLMDRDKVIAAFEKVDTIDLAICGAGMCEYLDMPNFDSEVFRSFFFYVFRSFFFYVFLFKIFEFILVFFMIFIIFIISEQ